MQVGENIYRLRSENSMSQGELSEILNVSRQSISKWENGMAMPELDKLIKLSRLFGVTLDQLVSDEETPKPCGQTRGKPGTGLILRWVAAGLMMIPSAVMLLVSLNKNGLFSLGGTEIICGAAMLTGVLLAFGQMLCDFHKNHSCQAPRGAEKTWKPLPTSWVFSAKTTVAFAPKGTATCRCSAP